jgi:hypothetical protein
LKRVALKLQAELTVTRRGWENAEAAAREVEEEKRQAREAAVAAAAAKAAAKEQSAVEEKKRQLAQKAGAKGAGLAAMLMAK